MENIKKYVFEHKKIIVMVVIVLFVIIYGGTKIFGTTTTTTSYVSGTVQKGNIISTVTGSGQVSASNEFALKTKASGDIIALNAVVGKEVKKGSLIAEVDPGTTGLALENARLSYNKKFTVDSTTLLQDQNAVDTASTSLETSYEQGKNQILSAYSSSGDILSNLKALYVNGGYLSSSIGASYGDTAKVYRDTAEGTFIDAQNATNESLLNFKSTDINSPEAIKTALNNVKNVVAKISIATVNAQKTADAIRLSGSNTTKDDSARISIASMVNSVNTLNSSIISTLSDISNSEGNLKEKQNNLAILKNGPDAVDTSSAQLSLAQQEESYQNYFTYAPFDGVLATLDIKQGDTVSSGASIGTFITKNQVADITLNEVDATKVKTGQKVTLTFDAVDGLTITGSVVQIDLVGTVSQGVVSYKVEIGFDTQDDRVKSGMSVSASIITDSRQNVLIVPTSAIKSNTDGSSFIEIPGSTSTTVPSQQTVEVGLSDNSNTEIISGLKEGDQIVTKTVTTTAAKASTAKPATSLLGGSGSRAIGGGGIPRTN